GKGPLAAIDGLFWVVLMNAPCQGGSGITGGDRFVGELSRHIYGAGRSAENVFRTHAGSCGAAADIEGRRTFIAAVDDIVEDRVVADAGVDGSKDRENPSRTRPSRENFVLPTRYLE